MIRSYGVPDANPERVPYKIIIIFFLIIEFDCKFMKFTIMNKHRVLRDFHLR